MHPLFAKKSILLLGFVLLLGLLTSCGDPTPEPAADLVILGGKIITLEEAPAEVQALAARDGVIVALGDEKTIRPYIGDSTTVLNLNGELVTPGLIEAHGHFEGFGNQLTTLDLTQAQSWEDLLSAVEQRTQNTPDGQWILGRGWHQEKWAAGFEPAVEGYPVHEALSAISPNHPVVLTHASGHATLVNAEALRLSGIDRSTPNPEGGTILRKANGEATGVLRETASALVRNAIENPNDPAAIKAARIENIKAAMQGSLEAGVTSFHDAGVAFEDAQLFKELADQGDLSVRLYVMLREPSDRLEQMLEGSRLVGHADNMLTVRTIKLSIDGALGSHGAWLLEPYSDLKDTSGLNTVPIDEVERIAALAKQHDFQLAVHAIGDRANRETLDIFENAFDHLDDLKTARWRVEHAQHLHPDDIPRFASLSILPSMQGVHCTSDGPWVPKRIGDARAEAGAYVWRKLMEAGSIIANGTDVPVEPIDPIQNFYASVTRQMQNGEAFYPSQVMTRLEALKSMTWNAAYFAFEEDIKGSLAEGKLADLTIFTQDLLTIPESEILNTEIHTTILGGEIKYQQ